MTQKESYYEILNISPKASDDDIRHAYHALAKKFHPDRNPQNRRLAELRFRAVNEAYANIKTRERRAIYNRSRRLKAQNDNKNTNKNTGGFLAQIGAIFRPKNKEIKN